MERILHLRVIQGHEHAYALTVSDGVLKYGTEVRNEENRENRKQREIRDFTENWRKK